MKTEVKNLWRQTKLRLWPERYWLISVAPEQLTLAAQTLRQVTSSFAALVLERDEVSLTLPEEAWQKCSAQFVNAKVAGPYCALTFDLNIELSVSGYLLPAAERLAEAGISIVPQCAFLKDHLLLQEEDTVRAMAIMQQMIAACHEAESS